MTKTYMAKPGEIEQAWYVVDASGRRLGRLATQVATVLMGKHKPTYTPHVDVGDYVVVTNAASIEITGKNRGDKRYLRYTYYPGGLKEDRLADMLAKHPERVVELAVRRMLPKTKMGRRMFKKLKVYPGSDHPHAAQQPKPLAIA